jgi:hypothetical protein
VRKWLSEVRATRYSLAEIGLLVVVREVFANKLAMTPVQADETLGPGWMACATSLAKRGVLRYRKGTLVMMSVAAPGDVKRERCRRLSRKSRAVKKFEGGVSK